MARAASPDLAKKIPQTKAIHFYRNVFNHVPTTKVCEISHMLKTIYAQESREAAQEKAVTVVADLRR